jgi:hypothetical protein
MLDYAREISGLQLYREVTASEVLRSAEIKRGVASSPARPALKLRLPVTICLIYLPVNSE